MLEGGLNRDAAGTCEFEPDVAHAPADPEPTAGVRVFESELGAYGGVFEDKRSGFDENGVAFLQCAYEDVAGAVEEHETWGVLGVEAVHENTNREVEASATSSFGCLPNGGVEPVVGDVGACHNERVLARVDRFALVEGQGYDLSRLVSRESYVPRAGGLRHQEWHAVEVSLPSVRYGEDAEGDLGVLPQEHVVGEVDGLPGGKADIGNRHIGALNLAGGMAKFEFGHILDARELLPTR